MFVNVESKAYVEVFFSSLKKNKNFLNTKCPQQVSLESLSQEQPPCTCWPITFPIWAPWQWWIRTDLCVYLISAFLSTTLKFQRVGENCWATPLSLAQSLALSRYFKNIFLKNTQISFLTVERSLCVHFCMHINTHRHIYPLGKCEH